MTIAYIIIGVFLFIVFLSGFVTVNQGNIAIITVFGKYRRIVGPGLNFRIL